MYSPFFGLNKEPFSIAPDPRFLFMSEMHREALAHLLYGLGGGGGFVLLTGEIGAGKTTVCRAFLEQLPPHCALAYIFNPRLTVTELLQTVCDEFGIASAAATAPGGATVKQLVDALNAFLLQAHAAGRQGVLIIDEAQSLSAEVLEQLRLLTNLETSERKLLQIVLIGQPELRAMLARPELEQLAQRVVARYHLPALNATQTVQYIQHRWAVAGPAAQMPFDTAALRRIHALSGGVPRRINLLCDRALLGAYAQGRSRIDKRTVAQAAREVFGSESKRAHGRQAAGALAVLTVLGIAMAGWWAATRPLPAPGGDAVAVPVLAASAAAVAMAASAASAAASSPPAMAVAPTPPAVAAAPATADPAEVLAAAHRVEDDAWRELGLLWNLAIAAGDPCSAAATADVRCYRSSSGLGVLRQLGRPALLTLRDAQGLPRQALLVALDDDRATLQVGQARWPLTLPALASVWRGEFATFWRAPPGWRPPGEGASSPEAQAWLQAALAQGGAPADPGTPLRARVWAFQLAQGLAPDGLAGPMTMMQLNRVAGVNEPRLKPET